MFRVFLVALIAAGVFLLMSGLPAVGGIFVVLSVISAVIAGLAFVIWLIKICFFGWL